MKFKTSHSVLARLLLVSSVFIPPAIMAQEPVIDQTVNQSVQQVNSTTSSGLQSVSNAIGQGNTYLENIWNHMSADYKNKEVAQAIINYEAAARMNEYNRNYELLFMPAPGTVDAVKAGEAVGGATVAEKALDYSNKALLGQVQPFTASENITGALGNQREAVANRLELFDSQFKDYYEKGNTDKLLIINPGKFLFSDNLKESEISDADTKQLIRFLTDPFPKGFSAAEFTAMSGLGPANLSGAGKEAIVNGLSQKAILAVSISALSDMMARRMPKDNPVGTPVGSTPPQSVMEIMNSQSKSRFTNPEWYKEVGVASDTALLRELVHIQAYNTWVQYQQFRIQEQQTALLATMNAIMSKMNVAMDQLGAKLDEAAAQAKQAAADAKAQAEELQKKMDEESGE